MRETILRRLAAAIQAASTPTATALISAGLLLALTTLPAGCKQNPSPKAEPTTAQAAPQPAIAQPTAARTTPPGATREAAPETSRVAKIVFIGQRESCDCTRKRIDDSFEAVQAALGTRDDIRVERLESDEDEADVALYKALRPILVLPAVYFLDASGGLVDMLQGELGEQRITAVLVGKTAAQ